MEMMQQIQELNERMQNFDWTHAFYDPMDQFNIDHNEDEIIFKQLEGIVHDLKKLASINQDGKKAAFILMKHHWKDHPMEIQIEHIKNTIMNTENFEYLKDQLKYHGFGEGLNEQLATKLHERPENFSLTHEVKYEGQTLKAELNFKQSGDRYYFNNYRASHEELKRGQTFYLNNGKGFTLKEAFNLLEGRAVYKELTNKNQEKYNAWVQLDLRSEDPSKHKLQQFTEAYGFDISKQLGDLQLSDNSLRSLPLIQQSLEKGNMQAIECTANGKKIELYAQATPQFKTIRLFNKDSVQLTKEQKADVLKPEAELKVEQNIRLKKAFPDAPKDEMKKEKKPEQKIKVK
jgi:hypothetical protein